MSPLEQRKKRGFCKYHNFLGHKISQCFLFRDLIQGAIKEGRLKFADKPPMKIDANPLRVDAYYAEPAGVNMVESSEDFVNMPVFGSFTGNISRKTVEAVRKAIKGLRKKATEGLSTNATEGQSKKANEGLRKGVTEDSN